MPFVSSLVTIKSPFVLFQASQLEIGYIAEDELLKNVTNEPSLTLIVVEGDAKIQTTGGNLYVTPLSTSAVVLSILYSGLHVFFSLKPTIAPTSVTEDEGASVYNTMRPPEVFTSAPGSVAQGNALATGSIYSTLSQDLRDLFLDFYPPFTGNLNWQDEINDYYKAWQDSYIFGLVVQTFKNIRVQRGNLYDLTKAITTYIYARLGLDIYVYIKEAGVSSLYWVLNESNLNESTILAPGNVQAFQNTIVYLKTNIANVPQIFQDELLEFLKKLFPLSAYPEIVITNDFEQFNLFIPFGDVYDHDPRVLVPFALKYDNSAVDEVVCLGTPFNPAFLVSLDYVPHGGNYAPDHPDIVLESVAKYDTGTQVYFLPVTAQTTFVSSDPLVISLTDNIADIVGSGTTTITAFFEGESAAYAFTVGAVSPWILDESALDDTTVLL